MKFLLSVQNMIENHHHSLIDTISTVGRAQKPQFLIFSACDLLKRKIVWQFFALQSIQTGYQKQIVGIVPEFRYNPLSY